MLDLSKEFALLGFVEETDEENNSYYVMDFPDGIFLTVTDDNGKMPERAKQNLVLACFDNDGLYLWGSELKTFMELQNLCKDKDAGSTALLEAVKNASKTLKDSDWATPSHP